MRPENLPHFQGLKRKWDIFPLLKRYLSSQTFFCDGVILMWKFAQYRKRREQPEEECGTRILLASFESFRIINCGNWSTVNKNIKLSVYRRVAEIQIRSEGRLAAVWHAIFCYKYSKWIPQWSRIKYMLLCVEYGSRLSAERSEFKEASCIAVDMRCSQYIWVVAFLFLHQFRRHIYHIVTLYVVLPRYIWVLVFFFGLSIFIILSHCDADCWTSKTVCLDRFID